MTTSTKNPRKTKLPESQAERVYTVWRKFRDLAAQQGESHCIFTADDHEEYDGFRVHGHDVASVVSTLWTISPTMLRSTVNKIREPLRKNGLVVTLVNGRSDPARSEMFVRAEWPPHYPYQPESRRHTTDDAASEVVADDQPADEDSDQDRAADPQDEDSDQDRVFNPQVMAQMAASSIDQMARWYEDALKAQREDIEILRGVLGQVQEILGTAYGIVHEMLRPEEEPALPEQVFSGASNEDHPRGGGV